MEQLAQYMEKAFIFEESGFLDEAVQLCNKCIQAFPEFKDDIELELAKMCFQMKDRLICQENNGIIKKISERGFVYETICYVCIALAIAIMNNCYSQCYS